MSTDSLVAKCLDSARESLKSRGKAYTTKAVLREATYLYRGLCTLKNPVVIVINDSDWEKLP